MEHTITMKEIKEMVNNGVSTFTKKDNSPRGCDCVDVSELQVGDEVVIDNYFTTIVEEEEIVEEVHTDGEKEGNTMTLGTILKSNVLQSLLTITVCEDSGLYATEITNYYTNSELLEMLNSDESLRKLLRKDVVINLAMGHFLIKVFVNAKLFDEVNYALDAINEDIEKELIV